MNLKGFFLIIELITVIVILITVANNVYLVENKIEIPGKVCEIFYKNKSQFYTKINGEMYPKFTPIYENVSINFECLNSIGSLKPKTILFWNKFNGLPFIPDLEKIIRSKNLVTNNVLENFNCPVNTCDVSFDRSKLQQSQMILFHLRNNIDEFPKIRHVNQHWVHVIYESPVHCSECARDDVTFNLSSTYTRESDFTSIYWSDSGLYWTEPKQQQQQQQHTNPIKKDIHSLKDSTYMAATLISASYTHRQNYITELGRHMSIEIYGEQGSFKCPKDANINCREFISDKYMFYILFENSVCRDYITEKFFDTLKYNIVPVVLGGGDYSYYIPKSGFINALDFKGPDDLAKFLIDLSKDKDAYNRYFEWKEFLGYRKAPLVQAFICEMCIKLLLEEANSLIEYKVIKNLRERFGMNENCRGQNGFKYVLGRYLEQQFWKSVE